MPQHIDETDLLTFWRKLNEELARLHEEPADFQDFQSVYATDAAVIWAAERIRAQRIRASHAEEGDDI